MYGIGSSNLAIGISLVMRDRFSSGARAASASLNNLSKQARTASIQQMEMQRNMNAVGAGIGISAMLGMREFVKVGAQFDKQMTYMHSISADKYGKTLSDMKTRAMEVGVATMFSTTEIAEGMTVLAQAGQKTEQIYNNIYSVAVLAASTMSGLESSASVMSDIMIGFKISATEKNATRVSDIITKTINDANIKLADFEEAIKYIIPQSTALGVSLEETAAMIGVVGNAGIKGSMAGTNIENMWRYAARAAGKEGKNKQTNALAMLGLSPKDLINSKNQLKSVGEIIPMIGTQLQKMSQHDISGYNAIMDIFGVRGARAAINLANNMAEFKTFLNEVNNSQGAAANTAEDVMGTLWGSSEQLQSTWENFKIVFTEAITPVLQPLIQGLTILADVLRRVIQLPIGKFLTILATGFIAVKTVIMGYKAIMLSIKLHHLAMGSSFLNSSNQVVTGYGRMAAAANSYRASAAGAATAATAAAFTTAQVQKFGGGAGYTILGKTPSGAYRARTPSGGYTFVSAQDANAIKAMQKGGYGGTMLTGAGRVKGDGGIAGGVRGGTPGGTVITRGGGMGRFGNMMGKASLPGMLGGMALQLGAESMRDENTGKLSTGGKAMDAAGSALSWGGTGAMIGSAFFPGIGTGVGAILGGVGGLLYSLYTNVDKVAEEVKNIKDPNGEEFNAEAWRKQVNILEKLGEKQTLYGKGWTPDITEMEQTTRLGAAKWLNNKGNISQDPNRITINIDGKKAMDKIVNDRQAELLINLAAF